MESAWKFLFISCDVKKTTDWVKQKGEFFDASKQMNKIVCIYFPWNNIYIQYIPHTSYRCLKIQEKQE